MYMTKIWKNWLFLLCNEPKPICWSQNLQTRSFHPNILHFLFKIIHYEDSIWELGLLIYSQICGVFLLNICGSCSDFYNRVSSYNLQDIITSMNSYIGIGIISKKLYIYLPFSLYIPHKPSFIS